MSFFWTGFVLRDFLFKSFNTHTISGFIAVCVALLSVGIVYEGINFWKRYLFEKFLDARKLQGQLGFQAVLTENDEVNENGEINPRNSLLQDGASEETGSRRTVRTNAGFNCNHYEFLYLLASSILHSIYAFIGFTLMNAVMTFNTWILIATCGGIGLGYFVFRPDSIENSFHETTSIESCQKFDSESDKTGVNSVSNEEEASSSSPRGRVGQDSNGRSHNEKQAPAAKVIIVGAQVHNHQQSL